MTELRRRFPSVRFVMERRVVQGNNVAARWRAEGAHSEPLMRGLHVFVFEGDRVAELWMHELDPDSCRDAGVPRRAA